jgi:luciferase family oxidoreductase group 1
MPAPEESNAAGAAPLRLSVLDQSPVSQGSTGTEALANTLDLARLADELGYHRYWVAEHHGTPMLAGASPEVLIGPIAASTSRIRVGSGGVMLPHYSPWKVAESFSVLSGMFGDRIDLGVGRGASADALHTHALQRDRRTPAPYDFLDQLAELVAHLEGRPPPDERFAKLSALPGLPARPEPWLLGSSLQSALWAARLGLPYAFGDFINPEGREMAHLYRESFVASERLAEPRVAVCVSAICAESDDEAGGLAASVQMSMARARADTPIPVPPPDEALRFLEEQEEAAADASAPGRRAVLGSPDTVKRGLEEVAAEYGAQEVIIVTITYSHEARRRSYELIAGAFRQ